MRIVKYSNRFFDKIVPLLGECTRGWGKEWKNEVLQSYSQPGAEAYVAEENNRITGTVLLKREVRALVIYFLAVSREDRMKGVGSALLKFVEKMAKKEKRILRVDVAKEFEKNADFYIKLGFKKCGLVKNFYMNGDEQIFLYKKPR